MSDAVARNFSKHAHHYDRFADAQRLIGEALLDMITEATTAPSVILDLGCGTGLMTQHLTQHYPHATCLALDIALPMAQQAQKHGLALQGDAQQLPLADQSIDMICSNLLLQWLPNTQLVLEECWRVLKPQGTLYFSTLGTDTLHEAKHALAAIDRAHHINPYHDIHQLGDQLHGMGWQQTVLSQTWHQLCYSKAEHVFKDLKNIGASTVLSRDQNTGLMTPHVWQTCLDAYPQDDQHQYRATYHAILARTIRGQSKPTADIEIPVHQIKRRTD